MIPRARPPVPTIVSLGLRPSVPGEAWPWHEHDFDELCLFGKSPTTIGQGGRRLDAAPYTLVLYLRGERHGFWNGPDQHPDLWVVHFDADDAYYEAVMPIRGLSERERRLTLSASQYEDFAALFVKLSFESGLERAGSPAMTSAWLQLLLGAVMRWRDDDSGTARVGPHVVDAELTELWELLSRHVREPFHDAARFSEAIPNYDSLRHKFKRTYGISPRSMLIRMKMQLAENLLLEGQMSVKQVAGAVGYWRQHEFARAFRRHTGEAPSAWRRRPHTLSERG